MDEFKVINYNSYDFSKSAIIKPKTENFDDLHRVPTKTVYFVLNSADRNITSYPNPNDYFIELFEDIQDVISVELKYANIKHNEYNVTNYNNKIIISKSSVQTEYTIPVGEYSGSTIAAALSMATGLTTTYNSINKHVIFASNEAFSLIPSATFQNDSMMKILGFTNTTQNAIWNSTTNQYEAESTYAIDLEPNNAIVINIDAMNVRVSNNNTLNKAFGIIPKNYNNIQTTDKYTIKKVFNPPVGRIDKLHIKFHDVYGNPYDFQNRDHILEFAFESHKNIRKYQAYLS
jgi:hypothetical protein